MWWVHRLPVWVWVRFHPKLHSYWATQHDALALLLLSSLGVPHPAAAARLARGVRQPAVGLDEWLGLVRAAPLWKSTPPAWPPLVAWRGRVGMPHGTLAQLATMRRGDWEEAWTRAGWRANRGLVRAALEWRAAPLAATLADGRALMHAAGF